MRRLAILLLAVLLQACGGGGGDTAPPPSAEACSIANQRQSLRGFMQEQYYWYRDMPAPDEGAATMDAYFRSMLVRPLDRFSYSQPTEEYQQVFTEGRRVGYGLHAGVVGHGAHAAAGAQRRAAQPRGPGRPGARRSHRGHRRRTRRRTSRPGCCRRSPRRACRAPSRRSRPRASGRCSR